MMKNNIASTSSLYFDKRLAKLQQAGQVIAQKLKLKTYNQIEKFLKKK